jgi:glutamate/tyrosine decarboxylase-like PLP-dependent enzyme
MNMNELEILSKTFEKIRSYLKSNQESGQEVVKFKNPGELKEIIDLKIPNTGVSEHEFLELIDKYLDYSVRTGHKQFLNQLYSGFNFPAFIGEIFTALSNTSMYTYEVAPVATLIEKEMITLMNSYCGYDQGDGIFVSGGSNANLIAMLSARNKILPECRFQGYDKKVKLKAFVSEQAHYSFETAANVIGIGTNNVIKVKSDEYGKMIPIELENEIIKSLNKHETPFFVGATCATTLLGAYDPLEALSKICKKYSLWLHADGSFGGSLILSDTHKYLMNGIEKTNSFTWNPHKLMNIPLVCSVLLVKNRGTLQHNITDINADYIFHDTDQIEDLGKKSIQCGRRVDAVKLWFAWKYFGLKGYQKRIDNLIKMARYAENIILEHEQLELITPRQSFSICFRFIPKFKTDLNKFNLEIRELMRKEGQTIVNYSYINNKLVIRLITANGELNYGDIDLFFENLLKTAVQIETRNTIVKT